MSSLVSLPDEEFEVLSEEDLTLLSRRFGHMYENRKGSRWVASTCYRCGKMGYFIPECPENADKIDHKHRPRDENKHRSREDKYKKIEYRSKHKNKGSGRRRSRSHERWCPAPRTRL
ncbi:hypothetical protein GQ55_3G255300 [Panicum hallii var. hallii]|uniref:CCHC-type domain-containing protein n=1 Tax=Panicum hallii var. hallii TaxID=1504633 RepID=A0A2T7EDA5_9POAL|nr:hypothetical protein GQ55_3G255300 [Panicum hallii var. hallii]